MYHRNEPAPVTSPYGTPDNPRTPTPAEAGKRGLRLGRFSWVLMPLGILGMIFGAPYLLGMGPDITVQAGSGFATIDGRDVMLVPYHREGGPDIWNDMFELRMTAIDVETGDEIWDEELVDELGLDAKVLAAGDEYVYLTTGEGLLIAELDDGDLVAANEDIDGLGENYLASFSAYGYDPDAGVITILDRDGGIRTIDIDATEATPAPDAIARVWGERLTDSGRFAPSGMTGEEMALTAPNQVVTLMSDGGTGMSLNLAFDNGRSQPLGDAVFYDATIVVDETAVYADIPTGITPSRRWGELTGNSVVTGTGTVAGLNADLVLVRHKDNDATDATRLSVVSLKTGEVLDTVQSEYDVGSATCRADGTVVVPIESEPEAFEFDQIAVVHPSGDITVHDIGDTGPFGG